MRTHVIVISGNGDKFSEKFKEKEGKLVVPFGIEGHPEAANISLYNEFEKHNLSINKTTDELFHIAVAVYTADVRTSRSVAFDGWTREFFIWMPVSDVDAWSAVKIHLEKAFGFLTGDKWTINFRSRHRSYSIPEPEQKSFSFPLNVDSVSLFSGGLDSFIGALDLISQKKKTLLIGHHSLGGGPTSTSQTKALNFIRKNTPETVAPFFHLWVSPKKGPNRQSEITTRGRSILFIALGVACAASSEAKILYIPENGFISLNVPLTASRSGSFSTRTTHPYFIWLLQEIINCMKIGVQIVLPYKFKTKGEMVADCLDQARINQAIKETMSCSHPGAGRWSGGSANMHCGYCVPCIIRKASIAHTRVDKTKYSYKRLTRTLSETKSLDYKSFKMAIERLRNDEISMLDILSAGPIPGTKKDKDNHFGVYIRGLEEVAAILKYKSLNII